MWAHIGQLLGKLEAISAYPTKPNLVSSRLDTDEQTAAT